MNKIKQMDPKTMVVAMLIPTIAPTLFGLGGFSVVVISSLKVESVLKVELVSKVEECCLTVDVGSIFEPGKFK